MQVPTFILVKEGWVDEDFSLHQHNEIWELAYPIRQRSEVAMQALNKSCLGKLLTDEEMSELKKEVLNA